MSRKSKSLVCAAAVGFAGLWGAMSLASACDKPQPYNYFPPQQTTTPDFFTPSFADNVGPAEIQDAEPTPPPAPALTKLRNAAPATKKRTARGPANNAALAKRARTLLNTKCASCHSRNGQASGLNLSSRQTILTGGDSGPAVVPGKPDESLLFQRVRDGEMPPRGGLSTQEVATLKQWIAAGAP